MTVPGIVLTFDEASAVELERARHVLDEHGLTAIVCPTCGPCEVGEGRQGCAVCDGDGIVFEGPPGWATPCGSACPLLLN